MNKNESFPCINCITLPICQSLKYKYDKYIIAWALLHKCSIISEWLICNNMDEHNFSDGLALINKNVIILENFMYDEES